MRRAGPLGTGWAGTRRREAGRDAFAGMARAGLVARGVVYAIIGVLAIELAAGDGGKATSQQGALQTIAAQPLGKVLLSVLAVGLAGYAAWRLIRAAIGHSTEERDNAFDRVSGAIGGLAYAALCAVAVKILLGAKSGGSSGSPKKAAAGVLGWPGGPILVGVAAVVLIGVAIYQGYKGLARKFMDTSNTSRMDHRLRRAYEVVGVVGHLARAVVFGLTGYGLLAAAIDYEPRKAIGLEGALSKLSKSSHGPLMLGIVAAGLIGFGLYSILDARYRRV